MGVITTEPGSRESAVMEVERADIISRITYIFALWDSGYQQAA